MVLHHLQISFSFFLNTYFLNTGPWIVAGFSDGYVRVLDRRQPTNRVVVRQWREHTSWVISAHLLNASQATTKIITGV